MGVHDHAALTTGFSPGRRGDNSIPGPRSPFLQVDSTFTGSCPAARVLSESGHICNPFRISLCSLKSSFAVSVRKSVLPAPVLVGGGYDCRLEQQVKAGGNALPSSSLCKGLVIPCLRQRQRQGMTLLGDCSTGLCQERENRYK